jgi:hypothetical protein
MDPRPVDVGTDKPDNDKADILVSAAGSIRLSSARASYRRERRSAAPDRPRPPSLGSAGLRLSSPCIVASFDPLLNKP